MNERIKELELEAIAYADSKVPAMDRYNDIYHSIVRGKFAELIVTECLKQTELARCSFNSQPQYTDKQNALVDEGFTWGADSCKDKIKQHFGVEE
jgi:hypothetical protein